jgi:hypothetical protein
MNIQDVLLEALKGLDSNRDRSLQTEIGVSQLGGCRTQVWLQLQGAPKGNETLRLASMMGTAIHTLIETALTAYSFGAYELEQEVEFGGVKGHIDWYVPEAGAVIDWKTTKLKNLEYFPSTQQRWQVHTYGYLLAKNGRKVETVSLVAIARDGDERNVLVHTEPYDESVALQALAWLEDVKSRTDKPDAEENAEVFCRHYCEYFGVSCEGKTFFKSGDPITDPVAITAAKDYLEISNEIKVLEARKESAKTALENVDGVTPDGISVNWSLVSGRRTIDEAVVLATMGEVPKKQGEPSMRLAVKG